MRFNPHTRTPFLGWLALSVLQVRAGLLAGLTVALVLSMSRGANFLRDIYGVLQQFRESHLPTISIRVGALVLTLLKKHFFRLKDLALRPLPEQYD